MASLGQLCCYASLARTAVEELSSVRSGDFAGGGGGGGVGTFCLQSQNHWLHCNMNPDDAAGTIIAAQRKQQEEQL